jgi:holo-[acyl-carrier protein] synthase
MSYIGIDIIEIARIKKAVAHWGGSFLKRVYTEPEIRLYHSKPSSLAARFAGKEAVIKALGAPAMGISWREIEILSDPSGRPRLRLYGRAQSQASSLGLTSLLLASRTAGNTLSPALLVKRVKTPRIRPVIFSRLGLSWKSRRKGV